MNEQWLLWLENFHFLRPMWLWALPVSIGMYYWVSRLSPRASMLGQLFNPVMLAFLTQQQDGAQTRSQRTPHGLVYVGLCLAITALAGPTAQQLPQPTYQAQIGQVIVMDMSLSMRATDSPPNRLTQARFKAIDYIQANPEANIGLVAYAGDAFVISPITQDGRNLTALIPSLRPELMPVYGSEPEQALREAFALLSQAGYQQGHVVWLTDGIDIEQQPALTRLLREQPYSVSIIAVGSEDGAPIMLRDGQLLKDNSGAIVIPKVDMSALAQLARIGDGVFTPLQPSDADIQAIRATLDAIPDEVNAILNTQNDKWVELGPYLLIPVIVMILWAVRPQYLLVLMLMFLLPNAPIAQAQLAKDPNMTIVPPPQHPQDIAVRDPLANLPQALRNRAQQALSAYQTQEFAKAAELFDDPQWQANALYQQGMYSEALPLFALDDSAVGHYNQGNTLASLQRYEEALAAYTEALNLDPDLQQAHDAKRLLEQFLENMPPSEQPQDGQQEPQSQEQSQEQSQDNSEQDSQSQDGQSQQPQEQSSSDSAQQSANDDASATDQQTSEQESADAEERDQQTESESQQQSAAEQSPEETPSEPQNGQSQVGELTPEQREQQERIQSLLNKVPDDPGYLLQRKMQLEFQKRQRQRQSDVPNRRNKEW
jgi:Ca-activated chloride channel family protein